VIVVSDAGPLIYLGAVGRLALLRDLFARVVVPRQVWDEVAGAGAERPGSAEAAAASWIDVRTPSLSPLTERLTDVLGTGEAAAIGLCLELHAECFSAMTSRPAASPRLRASALWEHSASSCEASAWDSWIPSARSWRPWSPWG
jgi:predicted nucleic acid-binding protein